VTRPLAAIALCLLTFAGLYGCAEGGTGFATLSDGKGIFVKCYGDDYSGDHEPQASVAKREACVAACRKNGFHVIDASSDPDSFGGSLIGDTPKRDAIPKECR
jgi:hypothetical protein